MKMNDRIQQPVEAGSQVRSAFPKLRHSKISFLKILTNQKTTRAVTRNSIGPVALATFGLFWFKPDSQPVCGFENRRNLCFRNPHLLAYSSFKALLLIGHLFEKDRMVCLLVMKVDHTSLGAFKKTDVSTCRFVPVNETTNSLLAPLPLPPLFFYGHLCLFPIASPSSSGLSLSEFRNFKL